MTTFFSASLQGHEDLGMPNFSVGAWTFRVVLQQRVLRQLLIFRAHSCASSSLWPPLSTQPHSLLGRNLSCLEYSKLTFRLMEGKYTWMLSTSESQEYVGRHHACAIWWRNVLVWLPLTGRGPQPCPPICLNSSLSFPLLPKTNTKV